MDWEKLRRSTNVQDRRGRGGGLAIGGGGIILALLASFIFGGNPLDYLGMLGGTGPQGQVQQTPANDRNAEFVARVLGDTEDVWGGIFQKAGGAYQPPTLVLFEDAVRSDGCGNATSAVGPFYCPADRNVYIDLSFFRELEQRLGAPGDFARAYVLAHEVGHHVQNLLGINEDVRRLQQARPAAANALSVKMELQADCFAGVWGHYTAERGIIDQADVRQAMTAAAAIGDDRLQLQSQGYVTPDSFTHGTSEQRMSWFTRGLESGDVNDCDTFAN